MTKPLQLSDEAYARLRNAKRGSESFSDVVLRILGGGDLTRLAGIRPKREIEAAERALRRADKLDRP